MKYRFCFILATVMILTILTPAYEVINISRDWYFDEQGVFTLNSIKFFLFDKHCNGEKDLIYECYLDANNGWQIDNEYVDVLQDIIGNNMVFTLSDGRYGSVHYSVYQPINGIYIVDKSYSLNGCEHFSLKIIYNASNECIIKIQGNVHGKKIMLDQNNNWTNVFDDGTSLVFSEYGLNIYQNLPPNNPIIQGTQDAENIGGTGGSRPPSGTPGCDCYLTCTCPDLPLM